MRASCCVMVEPPWASPEKVCSTAEAVRVKSMPWCAKKRWSSVEISAATTFGEMSASLTQSRLVRWNTASSLPSAESTMAGCCNLAFLTSPMLGVKGIRIKTYSSNSTGKAASDRAMPRRVGWRRRRRISAARGLIRLRSIFIRGESSVEFSAAL